MEELVKKYQQKFRKVRDEMERWDKLQSKLLSQFRNASSIIERLQIIQNHKNYGVLEYVGDIKEMVLRKQMESLTTILLSTNKTLEEFHGVVRFLEKSVCDGRQLINGATPEKLHERIGLKPTLAYCVDGLSRLYEMHHSEYLLKSSIMSALSQHALKPNGAADLSALQQLLIDQPNIPKEEVSLVFDIIFAEELR